MTIHLCRAAGLDRQGTVDYRRIVSTTPLGLGLQLKSTLALAVQRHFPGLYGMIALIGAKRWHRDAVPWKALDKPLSECTVALINSGGIIAPGQQPFDLASQAGDCSYRVIPGAETLELVRVSHAFYNSDAVHDDVEVLFPLATLRKLASDARIGAVAPRHFSLSGSIADPSELISDTAPEIAEILLSDEVDLVLLTPA